MKKILLGTILFLIPISVFAANGNGIPTQGTLEQKREAIHAIVEGAKQVKEAAKVLQQTREQIKEQTKEQLQIHKEELAQLKEQIRINYSGIGDLSKEEKQAIASDFAEIKSQLKDIHISNLYIRKGLSTPSVGIKDRIHKVLDFEEPTSEEGETIETILQSM